MKAFIIIFLNLALIANSYGRCLNGYTGNFTVTSNDLDGNGFYRSTNPTIFASDLLIPSGLSCTLTTDLTFYPGFGIKVAAGGVLVVEGATLSTCGAVGERWLGIEVLGDNSKPQVVLQNNTNISIINPAQGMVILRSNRTNSSDKTIIDRAWAGVRAGDTSGANGGAIVRAANTSFFNCEYAIRFNSYWDISYPERNLSYFTDCHFEWNDINYIKTDDADGILLVDRYRFMAHVQLEGVFGILFFGANKFINTLTAAEFIEPGTGYVLTFYDFDIVRDDPITNPVDQKYASRGVGINSINSSFYTMAGSPCKTPSEPYMADGCIVCQGPKNEFINLFQGIKAINNINKTKPTQLGLTGATFKNCHDGIVIRNAKNIFINRCDFKSDTLYDDYMIFPDPNGIKLFDCEKFDVSNNKFEYSINYSDSQCYATEGAMVMSENSSGARNRVYKNEISYADNKTNCGIPKFGTWVVNNNPNLEIECNKYNIDPYHNGYDILLSNLNNNSQNSIKPQGNNARGANNQFTDCLTTTNVTNIVLENWPTRVDYYYDFTSSNFIALDPVCIDDINGDFYENDVYYIDANTCEPTSYCKFFSDLHNEENYDEFTSGFTEDDMLETFGFMEGIDDFFEQETGETNGLNGQSNKLTENINVYPNPSNGNFVIEYNFPVITGKGFLEISDINGRILLSKKLLMPQGIEKVNNINLKPGVYVYKIIFNEQVSVGKFIKN